MNFEREEQSLLDPSPFQGSVTQRIPIFGDKPFLPLQALNPVQYNWTILVKITKILEISKVYSQKEKKNLVVLNVLLTDAEGTTTTGAFWNERAQLYKEILTEGKVYYFSGFVVKKAKKAHRHFGYPYELSFNDRTVVEEYAQGADLLIESSVKLLKFEDLRSKNPNDAVSILAIVKEVHELKENKRSGDRTPIVCRKLTLVDETSLSLQMTLWLERAEVLGAQMAKKCLEGDHPVILATIVCVDGSYKSGNLALNTKPWSELSINPTSPQAVQLKHWYSTTGIHQPTTNINHGSQDSRARLIPLTEVMDPTSVSHDKPTFNWTILSMLPICQNQDIYYLSNTMNRKKVIKENGRYVCVTDGTVHTSVELTYDLEARVADFSNTLCIQAFQKEVEKLIGISATKLNEIKKNNSYLYDFMLGSNCWKPMLCKIKTERHRKPKTDQFDLKYSASSLEEPNYAEVTKDLLSLIDLYHSAL